MIKEFNRQNLPILREKLDFALRGIASEFGIDITVGHCSYSPLNCTFKLELSTKNAEGTVNDKPRSEYLSAATLVRLDPAWIDQPVVIEGVKYRIRGLNLNRKHVVLLQNTANQKMYWFSAESVRLRMGGLDVVSRPPLKNEDISDMLKKGGSQ